MQISMHYSAEALGTHTLPLQLQIKGGRRLRLDLFAQCVEHSTQQAFLPEAEFPGKDGRVTLHDVHLSDDKPPLQMFSFHNTGPAELNWRLDLSPLEQMKQDNWGCAVAHEHVVSAVLAAELANQEIPYACVGMKYCLS